MYKNGYSAKAYKDIPVEVAPITAKVRRDAYELVCSMLSEGNKKIVDFVKAIKPLFGQYNAFPAAMLVYDILYSLNKDGKLKIDVLHVNGMVEGIDAPESRFSFID